MNLFINLLFLSHFGVGLICYFIMLEERDFFKQHVRTKLDLYFLVPVTYITFGYYSLFCLIKYFYENMKD